MGKRRTFDMTTEEGREAAMKNFAWVDHDILRRRFHNFHEIGEGAYRSNHPSYDRFRDYAQMGIKTVLNLRGVSKDPFHAFEVEWCKEFGLTLVSIQMYAQDAPSKAALNDLLDAFETMERPFLVHCKSGADRTGLAAAIYKLIYEGATIEDAKDCLRFKYHHIRRSGAGILDHFLELFEGAHLETGVDIVEWINGDYDPDALTASFAAKRKAWRLWDGWR